MGIDPVLFKVDAAGPRLCDISSYKTLAKAMGWGTTPEAEQPMHVPSRERSSPVPRERKSTLKRKAAPQNRDPPRSPSPRPAKRQPPPKRQGRKRTREDRSTPDSDSYPSSSSSSDALPSSSEVLAMLPENAKAPGSFRGKQKTACPTYASSIWPRDKPCCTHACGGQSAAPPSSTLYKPGQVLAVRVFWYSLSTTDRRQFIANRMDDVNTGGDLPTRRFYMDPPDVIRDGDLTLAASKRVSALYLSALCLFVLCVIGVIYAWVAKVLCVSVAIYCL